MNLSSLVKSYRTFGLDYFYLPELNLMGRIGYLIHGMPFIGNYIRFIHLKPFLDKIPKGSSIGDISFGSGSYTLYIANNNPESKVYATEVEAQYIRSLEDQCRRIKIKNVKTAYWNLNSPGLMPIREKTLDLLLNLEALDFAKNYRQWLHKLILVLKPGGRALVHARTKDWRGQSILPQSLFKNNRAYIETNSRWSLLTLQEWENELKTISGISWRLVPTFGFFGRLAWELDQCLAEFKLSKIKPVCLPFLKMLALCDQLFPRSKYRCGGVLLVIDKNY